MILKSNVLSVVKDMKPFSEHHLTIQRLSDRIADLENELSEYKDTDLRLSALQEAGVDNWEGYEHAMEIYNEERG